MEADKPVEVTGSDSTEKHQNVPPQIDGKHDDDECSFEISSIRLSEDQDSSPLDGDEDVPNSPKAPLSSPFRSRWVREMKDPNRFSGSPNIKSPLRNYTIATEQHTTSEVVKGFTESEFAMDFLNMDRSALDASAVTNSLLESSFVGPDSTNARLEAAYVWTKRENNALLKKIKDLEEEAAAREQAKLEELMRGMNSNSPMKWVKSMLGQTPDSGSRKSEIQEPELEPEQDVSKRLPSQLYPSELGSLALPTLSPTTINTDPRIDEPSHFEEIRYIFPNENNAHSSPFRRMMLLFLLALICSILLAHRERVEFAAKEAMSKAAPILKEHEPLLDDIATRMSKTRDLVEATFKPVKDLVLPHFTSVVTICQRNYEHYAHVAAEEFDNLQQKLGLKLDWESDILPMATHFAGKESEAPLEGLNVVVVRASTAVGNELTNVFSRLGARVLAVDSSAKYLASVKTTTPFVDTMKVDFADLVSVADVAADIAESISPIDILINCANDYSRSYGETKQGYDMDFGRNFLSEFLLTTKLLEQLSQSTRAGIIVQLQSAAHILVDGSDLYVDPATSDQPFASIPGEVNSLLAYSNSALASSLHTQYLSETEKRVKVKRITLTPFIPAMSAWAVLATVLQQDDAKTATESIHSSFMVAKHKLGIFKDQFISPGKFTNPFEEEELLGNLMQWSEEAISPYLWTKMEPKTVDILQETTHWISDDDDGSSEISEYNAFYASSIATLVSVGSLSLLRQLMPSRH